MRLVLALGVVVPLLVSFSNTSARQAEVPPPVANTTAPTASAPATAPPIDYLRQVRPILAQSCYHCHGPDANTRKADLRLDLRGEALADRDGEKVIAPGDVAQSGLIARITTTDADDRMPPPGECEPLTEAQIATLTAWIEQGANWPEHWAFVPPVRHAAPTLSQEAAGWVADSLDTWIRARLEKEGLAPEAEADRVAWLRRVTFDLTGMPPTLKELDDFARDKSATAHEKAVDRLLASPRYGERQAAEWLDLARYADSSGYQRDGGRNVWKWREWVIGAFNRNLPYDQFAIEQLAGDLLPNATLDQRVATGFNRNHPTNSEAGEEEDEYRSAYVIDRVSTMSTVFMGLTMGCCQCHDHKYDPFSQRDFYQLYAFFNNVKERDSDGFGSSNPRPSIPVPNPDQDAHLAQVQARRAALEARLAAPDPLSDGEQAEWEKRTLERIGEQDVKWTTLEPTGMVSKNGSHLKLQDDGSVLATGPTPVRDTYEIVLQPGKQHVAALRLEVLPDPSQPKGGSGRADDGRFILSRLEIRNSTLSESQEPPLLFIVRAESDINQKVDREAIDADPFKGDPSDISTAIAVEAKVEDSSGGGMNFDFGGSGWSIAGDERGVPHEAVLLPQDSLDLNEASVLRISMLHTSQEKFKSLVGRFRWSFTDDERIRSEMLPILARTWSAIGPFPHESAEKAYATAFALENELPGAFDLAKSYDKPKLPEPTPTPEGEKGDSEKKAGDEAKSGGPPKAKPAAGDTAANPEPNAQLAAGETKAETALEKPETAGVGGGPGKKGFGKKGEGFGGDKNDKKPSAGEPAAEGAGDAPSAESANKPEAAGPEAKAGDKGEKTLAEAKAGDNKKPAIADDKKPSDDKKTEKAAKPGEGDERASKKPERLAWKEMPTWKDGARQKVEANETGAYYFTRKVTSRVARTAQLSLSGPLAYKVWLNGELVASKEPEPPAKEDPKAKKGGDEFDFEKMMRGDRETTPTQRIGLRAGENEIVIKAIYAVAAKRSPGEGMGGGGGGFGGGGFGRGGGGGASLTFDLTPEGEDVLNREVILALRGEAAARLAAPKVVLAEPTPSDSLASGPHAGDRQADAPADKSPPPATSSLAPTPVKDVAGERRRSVIRDHFRRNLSVIGRALAEELKRAKDEENKLKRAIPETMVMEDLEKPRQTFIFKRGQYKHHGDPVNAATPAALPPMATDLPKNRLGLAKWVVSKEHPLTARVAVNRIWAQYFGTGLVRTAEDFGIRSEQPSHPELLDELALDFIESGFDMKKLHRRIVLSATYRQAATSPKEKLERDPENRLLARGPHRRLTAEMIRDQALAVSNLLVDKVGGPSVKPFQPAGLWKQISGGQDYARDTTADQYRRGLYVYWKRGAPYPSMLTFDASKRETCTVSRPYTTTPLQALVLLNDPVYVECAKMFGARILKEGGKDDAARLAFGFRCATSRKATDAELAILTDLLAKQRAAYAADGDAAKKLLGVGDAKVDEKLDPKEAAAWAAVASALLNLDESIRRG